METFTEGHMQDDNMWADEKFIAELDRRTAEYESGKAKVFTLDQLETRVKKGSQACLQSAVNQYLVQIAVSFPVSLNRFRTN